MKNLMLALLCLGLSASADHVPPRTASARIREVVEAFKPFAWSGVSHYKVQAGLSVRETLKAVSEQEDSGRFSWATEDQDAWATDEDLWGWSNMKAARSYLTKVDDAFFESIENPKKRKAMEAKFEKAKKTFSKLEHTGVLFGVAPLGAIQCGVRFAALAVIDPHTGNVWIVSMEASGC